MVHSRSGCRYTIGFSDSVAEVADASHAGSSRTPVRRPGLRSSRLGIAILLIALVNIACFVSVAIDRANIRSVAFQIIEPGPDKAAIAQACMAYVNGTQCDNSLDSVKAMPFLTRMNYLWNPRRVGPGTIVRYGTHPVAPCQSHSRLMIALMEAHGIPARQISLHDSSLRGSHGIVEVDLDDHVHEVVDPQYGIIYRHPDGRPASLGELMKDPALAVSNQMGAFRHHIIPGKETKAYAFPINQDGYRFDSAAYCNYRNFGPFRWKVRDLLRYWYGESGDLVLHDPNWYVLWPAYNLAFTLDLLFAGCIISMLVIARWQRGQASAS